MALTSKIKTLLFESRNLMLCGLTLIAIGLSVSKPLISLGLIVMAFAWVVDGKFIKRFKLFLKNRSAMLIASVYFISVLGLIHTSNFEYGFDDVRRKLSLFLIPMFMAGYKPLTTKELNFLLKVYVFWVLFSCTWSICIYLGITGIEVIDKRDYARYTSHIRFGLEIAIAVFICLRFFIRGERLSRYAWLLAVMYLLLTIYLFSFMTGAVVILFSIFVLFFVFGLLQKNRMKKVIFLSIVGLTLFSVVHFVYSSVQDFYENDSVEPITEIQQTKYGNPYQKDAYTDNSNIKENGYYVERNISWVELENAWEERSNIKFNEKDLKGNYIKNTIIRFLTSKGYRKDKEGVDRLTSAEIAAIERGVSNFKYLEYNGFRTRAHKIIWELDAYKSGRDINGHSISMRWEYLNITWELIKDNFWFGLGTGDIRDAFKAYYQDHNSVLREPYRRRGHNQYLTYTLTLGVFGFVWFVVVLFYPLIRLRKYKDFLYLAFFCIISASMFTEDTLETQVGINIFVFFNSILLLRENQSEEQLANEQKQL